MSPKNSFLKASLSALGIFGFAVSEATADAPAPSSTDQASIAAPVPESGDAVLLKSDGTVLRGKVTQTNTGYRLTVRGNAIPFKHTDVQGVFGSLEEAYRFQADHVPARDPDEQMKLARWCMTHKLMAEAKVHLTVVQTLAPNSAAKRMLDGIELAEARTQPKDPDVRTTGAEMPRELNLGSAHSRKRGAPTGPPQIFDLPPGLALRRANEFARHVQPVLQRACATCHNENYAGDFQLIQFRGKHDATPEAQRMNLDATLRLVDVENPGKSELLSSGLRPHGDGPRQRRIFAGPNNPDYQILLTWVNSLKAQRPASGVIQTRAAGPDEEEFAVGRSNRVPTLSGSEPSFPKPIGMPTALSGPPQQIPPKRYVPGQGLVDETAPPSPGEFPVPFAVSGQAPPKLPTVPATAGAVTPRGAAGVTAPGELPNLPATPIPPPVPPPGSAAAAGTTTTGNKPRKPVKLDENLLQKVLQNRNGQQ